MSLWKYLMFVMIFIVFIVAIKFYKAKIPSLVGTFKNILSRLIYLPMWKPFWYPSVFHKCANVEEPKTTFKRPTFGSILGSLCFFWQIWHQIGILIATELGTWAGSFSCNCFTVLMCGWLTWKKLKINSMLQL